MISYDEVNKALDNVIGYLRTNESIWNETRNLKLYDVSFQAADIIEKYPLVKQEYNDCDLFQWFCENSYDEFTEWLDESNIEDCRKYIGRTSSFYLTDLHDDCIGNVVSDLFSRVYSDNIDFDKDGHMEHFCEWCDYTEADLLEEYQDDMHYIVDGCFFNDIEEYLHDAFLIAGYIDDFKENQIKYFTEYIEMRNEELEYVAQREAETEQAFITEYKTAINKLTEAIENIIRETGCTLSDARQILNRSFDNVSIEKVETVINAERIA